MPPKNYPAVLFGCGVFLALLPVVVVMSLLAAMVPVSRVPTLLAFLALPFALLLARALAGALGFWLGSRSVRYYGSERFTVLLGAGYALVAVPASWLLAMIIGLSLLTTMILSIAMCFGAGVLAVRLAGNSDSAPG